MKAISEMAQEEVTLTIQEAKRELKKKSKNELIAIVLHLSLTLAQLKEKNDEKSNAGAAAQS